MAEKRTTILVVDDDDLVRDLASRVLEDEGYRVLAASNADEALVFLERHPEVALLFTDVVMPGTNGFALARKAKSHRPDLKVVYASGYVSLVESSDLDDHDGPLLNKPYRPTQLLAEIAQALSAPTRRGGRRRDRASDNPPGTRLRSGGSR